MVTMNTAESVTATFTQLFTLSVNETGSGTVTSSPTGIDCGSTCSANYASGTQVTLTATPVSGGSFTGWSGACSGTGSCIVTMNAAKSVSATFSQVNYALLVGVSGSGTVTSSPPGISCPSTCSANFGSGAVVTLNATPSGGASFTGWGGACSGAGSCVVTMNAAEDVSANFTPSGGSQATKTWVSAPSGSDSNPCTRTSPCRSFAEALAHTTAGGEIDLLAPGDYGPVTITKAVSIYNDGAGVAGAVATSGTSGITVIAGSTDAVNLRGLSFNGFTASGASGIVFDSGAQLHIANCTFQGFATSGITFSPGTGSAATAEMVVQDSTIIANGGGLTIKPTGGIAVHASLNKVHIDRNTGGGLRADGTGGSGAVKVAVKDSSVSLNTSNGINAVSGPGNVAVNITRSVVASNGLTGIQSNQAKGGTASVAVGSSQLYGNTTGVQSVSGGTLLTYPNNQMTNNMINGSFTGNASLQ